tara:strand:+ start:381 stop:632 length:252 start_codon:yes stop_codon:yes gene_type:complete
MRTTDEMHGNRFEKILKGKKVDSCRYLTQDEADDMGWFKRPLAIMFTDGTYLVLQSDDEGNDGGAAFLGGDTDDKRNPVIYTI